VIVHRGTKRISDWFDDALIGLGLQNHSHRYLNAQRLTNKVREKYKQEPSAYGDSLGGYLASHNGTRGKIITYNKLTPLYEINRTIPNNQTDKRLKNDVVSLPAKLQKYKHKILLELNQKHKTGNPTVDAYNAHSLKKI
jgi:hypothetical protein